MKAIIQGKRYDTDKAIEIGEASHGSGGDFSAWEATLYKTPKAGRFFLAGSGGPMTRWARSAGVNETSGSSGIIPLEDEEALEWAEHHLGADAIEEHFSDAIQDA